MPVNDTSAAPRDLVLHFLRGITPSARVALACELSEEAMSVSADGMRFRHPGLSDEEVAEAVRQLLLGAEVAERVGAGQMPPR